MKISVCVTTCNGGRYVKHQLESILSQLGENDEVIISDDSSTDDTVQKIKSVQDSRIQLYEGMTFGHHTPNFEFALSMASGDYIFLSDQDDVWHCEKVATMMRWFPEYDLVTSDCKVVNENLEEILPSFFKEKYNRSGFFKNVIHNSFLGCCMAFSRRTLDLSLPFPAGNLSHESWIGAVAGAFGKTKFIPDKLILFRRHSSNNSNTLKGSDLTIKAKVVYRFRLVVNILKLVIKEDARFNWRRK
jgi:glycosyltransferase involved in cell wall biosynthesis